MSSRRTRSRSRTAATRRLARARERAMPIALDPASAAPLELTPEFAAWAGPVDLLLANAAEAAVLDDAPAARERVTKRGAFGASWTDGASAVSHPASAVAL